MAETGSVKHATSYNKRVSHTLHKKTTSSITPATKSIRDESIQGYDNCNSGNAKTKRTRGGHTFSEFPVNYVSSPKSRRHQSSYLQPERLKRICLHRSIQADKCTSCPRLSPAQRLALQSGPFTSILQSASMPLPQMFFKANVQRKITTNDLSPLWSQYGTQSIRYSNKLGSTDLKTRGYPNIGLFGRFSCGSPRLSQVTGTDSNSIKSPPVFGMARKHCEINYLPLQESGISRCSMEPLAKQKILTTGKNYKNTRKYTRPPTKAGIDIKDTTEFSRSIKLRKFCSSEGQTQFSQYSSVPKSELKKRLRQYSVNQRSEGRPPMVEKKLSPGFRDTPSDTFTLFNDRRVGFSMGSAAQRMRPVGIVDKPRKTTPLQSKGNAGNTENLRRKRYTVVQVNCPSAMRQQDGSSFFTKRRRNEVCTINEIDKKGVSSPRVVSDKPENAAHSRKIQRPRRPSFSPSEPAGMAPVTPVYRKDFQEVWSTHDRLVRIGTSKSSDELRISRSKRLPSDIPRRFFSNLELSTSLGVPTALPCAQSFSSPQLSIRCVSVNSPKMGASILESRLKSPSIGSSVYNTKTAPSPHRHGNGPSTTQSPRNDVGGMEMWGWSQNLVDWNDSQLQLLKSSWRPSTKKTYKAAWNRWLTWTKKHKLDPLQPTGQDLARFLADLYIIEGLAYNTILLHKSVVCTLCNSDNSGKLNSHVLVRHILKSIALKNPVSQKPLIWNVDKLAIYLENYSVNENNVFATCRHTATLLLLCSGRRIHDLTLLAVDPKHLSEDNDCLILWPLFGSKTDTANYRQSGWRLSPNIANKNLDPVFWVKRSISILHDKRLAGGFVNLFLNLKGHVRVASRTVIAGWVKTLLVEAGVVATPGSLRSAVASKNWHNNYPLDEILSRGNWKSQNTFKRYYCKEIMHSTPTSTNCDLAKMFDSVRK
jgi:hypothetical protein